MRRCKRNLSWLSILYLLFLWSGCKHIHRDYAMNAKEEKGERKEIAFFEYRQYPAIHPTLEPSVGTLTNRAAIKIYSWFERERYAVYRFTYPVAKVVADSEATVVAYYYKPKKLKVGQKIPLIIVFPILDGDHLVSEWQSKRLANAGFAVVRFEKKKGFLKTDVTPDFHREILQQTIIDARRALDWLCTLPEIDHTKIGVSGVSLGGICSSLLMATDDRIRAGSFFLFGGNIPKIIATSNEVNVTKWRQTLLERHPNENLEDVLRPYYEPVDPYTYASTLPVQHIQIFSANRDRVILPEITKDIWHKMHEPYWIQLPFVGHFSAAVYFFYGSKQMIYFFRKQFRDSKN